MSFKKSAQAIQNRNRKNAQHSTGPKTPEGKLASSSNALKHGLDSQNALIIGESKQAYADHTQSFINQLKPIGAVELSLVKSLADTAWRQQRCRSLEASLQTPGMSQPLATVLHQVELMGRHALRLARLFAADLKLIRELQAERRATEQAELNAAADTLKYSLRQDLDFDPQDLGFVPASAEIAQHLRRREARDLGRTDGLYPWNPTDGKIPEPCGGPCRI